MSKNTFELPLFPLRTILFPGGVLPLRIFEPRYIDMVGDCMKSGGGFGICAAAESGRSNNVTEIYTIGTEVKIIDFESLPENLLGITVKGQNKFMVIESRVMHNHLRIAEISYCETEVRMNIPNRYRRLSDLLKRMLPDVKKYYGDAHLRSIELDFDDAGWVGARLTEYLPFELNIKQRLLECNDPIRRLQVLYDTLKDEH